ncbi:MAG TPA: radical SAM protein, partial [Acidobacteriota bacterium]|nr:radical SAM protein [Acidobacteriota bacterium]
IALFCKGIRIDATCAIDEDGRLFSRTRAGLGSGLELVIPGDLKDIWMNVPVEEDFAQKSPYLLVKRSKDYMILDESQNAVYPVIIPTEPSWYSQKTGSGVPMYRVGVLQGTYLGIYLSNSCSYWFQEPAVNCKFCTTGYNVGVNEVAVKSVDDVVETAQAAKQESGITFIHFNSGFQNDRDLDLAGPYVKGIKERVGLLVGIQMVPTGNLWKYDWLMDLGVNHFSFCYEFHNPEYFARYCPGKEKTLGQKAFFKALEYTVQKLGKGSCSGEIIAGVEPLEDTADAIDYITDIGAFPTVCIFRPVIGSDMEDHPAPKYEDMVQIMRYMYECCVKKGIPIGVAPNIEVSLIVQPDDGRYLVPRDFRFYKNELLLKAKRFLARKFVFEKELTPKQIDASVKNPESYKTKWHDQTRYSALALGRQDVCQSCTIERNVT